jgi:hypothetical protein
MHPPSTQAGRSLIDLVELPAGTVELDRRELVVTLDPLRALVVERRALPMVLKIAPDLASDSLVETARGAPIRSRLSSPKPTVIQCSD